MSIQTDIQLIRKFNGPDLLDSITYLVGGWGKLVPEIVPCKRVASPHYLEKHAPKTDTSQTYYDSYEVAFPEVTPKRTQHEH